MVFKSKSNLNISKSKDGNYYLIKMYDNITGTRWPRSIIFNINLQVNSKYFKLIKGVLGILVGGAFKS